jgi:hypothetical protein
MIPMAELRRRVDPKDPSGMGFQRSQYQTDVLELKYRRKPSGYIDEAIHFDELSIVDLGCEALGVRKKLIQREAIEGNIHGIVPKKPKRGEQSPFHSLLSVQIPPISQSLQPLVESPRLSPIRLGQKHTEFIFIRIPTSYGFRS